MAMPMKKFLCLVFFLSLGAIASAGAQTFRAPVSEHRPTQRAPVPVTRGKAVGAFARAARGNPIQLLNPRAPIKYRAVPQDTVTFEDSTPNPQRNRGESPNRLVGIVFFGLRW